MTRRGVPASARLRQRLQSRQFRECEVSWCRERTAGLSRHCYLHRDRRRSTGDPEGTTLRRSHVRRHAARAKAYLLQHRGHEAIEAGLSWAYQWLRWGRSYGSTWRHLSPIKQARQYLHRLSSEGVHEADVLSVLAAVSFIREYEPGHIRSDDHFRFQSVVHVLGLAPWPSEGGNGKTRQRYFRPTPPAVDILWQSIPAPILVLARGIAAKIDEEQSGPGVDETALSQSLPTTTNER